MSGPKLGDRVWLVPRTLAAPAVCYRQATGTVVDLTEWPYVLVELVDGQRHEVHCDNLTATDPTRRVPAARRGGRPRVPEMTLPDGWTEVPLW